MQHPYQIGTVCCALATAMSIVAMSAGLAAADEQALETEVVTATRFNEPDPGIAANISVIFPAHLRNSPAKNLPDVLRTRAGIDVRQLGGAMGRDAKFFTFHDVKIFNARFSRCLIGNVLAIASFLTPDQ